MLTYKYRETEIPGDNKKNNYVTQTDISSFVKSVVALCPFLLLRILRLYDRTVQGDIKFLSVPTGVNAPASSSVDPSAWTTRCQQATILNGQNPNQDPYYNLPAAAATRGVGGMSSHWTACTPRQHPTLERSTLFTNQEWDALYNEAEGRIKTTETLVNDSIRHQLVLQELRKYNYGNGDREFKSMPLAAEHIPEQRYIQWSSAATMFGDITRTADRPGNELFTLKSQIRCTKLEVDNANGVALGKINGVMCKNLRTGEEFLVQAKKYVICAGAVLTPGILFNSGFAPEDGGLPALVSTLSPLRFFLRRRVLTWGDLPSQGKYLTEQTMTFCQVILSHSLVEQVANNPDPAWKERVEKHRKDFPKDPLPFPFNDPDPQVTTPVTEAYPWHTQIHRDAFSYGDVPPSVDQRVVVDLRFFGFVKPVKENCVTFCKDITDQFGMPQPTFHFEVPREDAERSRRMMEDMCIVASKLGGFLPGAEPKFLLAGAPMHICGTTRAGESREDSVCDKFGRVWDTQNLVVGGCNVIPTQNASNPTLTAIAFAIAGADQMIRDLKELRVKA